MPTALRSDFECRPLLHLDLTKLALDSWSQGIRSMTRFLGRELE